MTREARIQAQLEALYPQTPIPLDHVDPFTLLVAVMLSAQTTDKKVNQVTPALFARAPDPQTMAAVPVEELREILREIGLAPTKARNVKAMSELLLTRHGGAVPSDLKALEALPGVGHKTAQVVVAQAFGQPAFPVDTHIHRLAWRWGLSEGRSVQHTERDLKRCFPESAWNGLHLRIIFFGREYCPARYHDHDRCPICSWAASPEVRAADTQADQAARTRKPSRA